MPAASARSTELREPALGLVELAPVLVGAGQQVATAQLGVHRPGLDRAVDRLAQRLAEPLLARAQAQPGQRGDHLGREVGAVELVGEREGVEADLLGLLVSPEHREHVGVRGEHPGAGQGVVVGRHPDGLRGDRGRVLVGLDGGERDGPGGEERAAGGGRGVGGQGGELLGEQRGGPLGVTAAAERLGRVDGQPGAVDQAVAGGAEAGEQPQGPLEVLRRLVGTADLGGLATRLDAGRERGLLVVGELGVAGQLGSRAARATVADRGGVPGVQPDPLAGQQVVVDGLAEQRVPEGVVPVAGDEDVALDGGAQALVEGSVADVGGDREQLVGDPSAGDAGRAHDLAGRLVEAVEPHQQQLGEIGGERVVMGAGGRADQLLHEEGVALGALDDHVDLVVGEPGASRRPDR